MKRRRSGFRRFLPDSAGGWSHVDSADARRLRRETEDFGTTRE